MVQKQALIEGVEAGFANEGTEKTPDTYRCLGSMGAVVSQDS
jgi:hypothetical protein